MRPKLIHLVPLFLLSACGTQRARPNVILVLADTLRADFLGCYGFDGPVSPNLDALAEESLRFEACISQAPWTKPAIASLFTSLYPQTHGIVTHEGMFAERSTEEGGVACALETDILPESALTLAESMSQGGYETQAFVTNPWIRREHGFHQGFRGFEEWLPAERSTAELFESASRWIETRTSEAPYFLYVHAMEVHGPYDSPEPDFEAVQSSPGLGPSRPLSTRDQRRLPEYLRLAPWARGMGAGDLRTWRGRYAAGVHAFDHQLARFVGRLDAQGGLANTLLIVTADHGEELLEHGNWDHGSSLHDHQLRVPLLIRTPGPTRYGRAVSTPVELIDLPPTILSFAGLGRVAGHQGRDLTAWFAGDLGDDAPPSHALSTGVKWRPELVSLRSATHRLILGHEDGAPELFDVRRDPNEQVNLAGEEPRLVRELSELLLERLRVVESVPALVGERASVSEDLREKLGDLGYY